MATKTVKKEGWVNLYQPHYKTLTAKTSDVYSKESDAKKLIAGDGYIATIKIEWEQEA